MEKKNTKTKGVEIDRTLNFHDHVKNYVKKLSVSARLSNFMNISQKRLKMKSFIESQFGYCPLVWMFYSIPPTQGISIKTGEFY